MTLSFPQSSMAGDHKPACHPQLTFINQDRPIVSVSPPQMTPTDTLLRSAPCTEFLQGFKHKARLKLSWAVHEYFAAGCGWCDSDCYPCAMNLPRCAI
jgi:hypothetical protein